MSHIVAKSSQHVPSPPPLWYQLALRLFVPLYRLRIRQRFGHLPDYQAELRQRFGPFEAVKNRRAMWVHAVSVGETNAAAPLVAHYLEQGQAVLVTNTTRTGQARAMTLFAERYPQLFQAVYLPVDIRHIVSDFIDRYQPSMVLLMETELWANLIDQLYRRSIPVLLLNARLSHKSANGYARIGAFTRNMLQKLNFIAAQDEATRQRLIKLGAYREHVEVFGSIKFDISPPPEAIAQAELLHHEWHLAQRKIMLLASTHAPEEQHVIAELVPYLQQNPQLLCIVVPRHPERFEEVASQIAQLGLAMQRRSLGQSIQADTQIYLADSMGEMWLWYALSSVAYVGGSLNQPGGGHNILESMACGVATVLGKHYFNFQTIVDECIAHDAVVVVDDFAGAASQLVQLVQNDAQRHRLVKHAHAVMHANRGSLARHIALIDAYL